MNLLNDGRMSCKQYTWPGTGNLGVQSGGSGGSNALPQFGNPAWVSGFVQNSAGITGTGWSEGNPQAGALSGIIYYNHADANMWSTPVNEKAVNAYATNAMDESVMTQYMLDNVAIPAQSSQLSTTEENVLCPPNGEWMPYAFGGPTHDINYMSNTCTGYSGKCATVSCSGPGLCGCSDCCEPLGSPAYCIRSQFLGDPGTCALINSPSNIQQGLPILAEMSSSLGVNNNVYSFIQNQMNAGQDAQIQTTDNIDPSSPFAGIYPSQPNGLPFSMQNVYGFTYTCPPTSVGINGALYPQNAPAVAQVCSNVEAIDSLWAINGLCTNWMKDALNSTVPGSSTVAGETMAYVISTLFSSTGAAQQGTEAISISDVSHAEAIANILATTRLIQDTAPGAIGTLGIAGLQNACSAISRDEINNVYLTYSGSRAKSTPLNYQNLVNACSCFMPIDQYNTIQDLQGPQCDPICAPYAGYNLGPVRPGGNPCKATICEIDDVTFNIVGSSQINFNQICQGTGSSAVFCEVYDVNVNSSTAANFDAFIKQQCSSNGKGTCINGSTGQPFNCALGFAGLWESSTVNSSTSSTPSPTNLSKASKWSIILGSIGVGLLILGLIYVLIRRYRK